MTNWLLEPLHYTFMQSGLLAAVLVGLTCAVLGVYVVLRRMAFIGDALAHTVLPGLVIAYLNSWNLAGGALTAGLATALLIGWLSERREMREDTAIGIVFTGMFALGILLMSTVRSFRDFTHMLFGNILGVTSSELLFIGGVAIIVLTLLALFHKELELTSVDPGYAAVIGLRVHWLRYLLLCLLALAVVSAIQAVGVVLTSALLVTPAATASLLTQRLTPMMGLAALIAVLSGVVGLYISYYGSVSSGAAIVLVCTLCFGVAWVARWARSK
ncbi:MAG: metal ABC transporter permease [Caldilineaceae bacterium]|nr:metal ABC transporter permease [Caldilineaceae bacterium]MCB9149721.1 metal ABC transporter permease [Caldilineaceae bacterium]